jgi:hypothetical protein
MEITGVVWLDEVIDEIESRHRVRPSVGKVSRVAEALPHSEGARYKRLGREIPACRRDLRMGS